MIIDYTDQELDYTYRLYLTRPMGEVEPLVLKIRQQIARQQPPQLAPVPAEEPTTLESLP